MRNGFFAAIPIALFGAALVHGQEVAPVPDAVAPAGPVVSTPVWSAPLPDDASPTSPTVLEGTPASKGGFGSHVYLSGDYLLWGTSQFPVSVPLVTAGTVSSKGQLHQPGTTVLFGDQRLGVGTANGFRIMGGGWLTENGWLRGEIGGFILQPQGTSFAASSNGTSGPAVLAEPFFSSNSGTEDALILAAPGMAIGSVWVGASSQLRGAEANILHDFATSDSAQASFLIGVRYVNLNESLNILDTILPQTILPFGNTFASPGDTIRVGDHLQVHNHFLGPQIGGRLRYQLGVLAAELTGKMALGTNRSTLGVNGESTLISNVVGNQTVPGGLFALPSNGNGASNSQLCFVPEVGANIGVQLLPSVYFRVGYTFLYMTSVGRVGQQINRNIDATQVPASQFFGFPGGNGQPLVNTVNHGNYFAQGLNLGLEFRF